MARAVSLQDEINGNPSALGLAVIISNDYKDTPRQIYLEGTEKDGVAMADCFKDLGYMVTRKHNATQSYTIALLHKVGRDINYPASYRRIVFVFAGHGESEGNLITSEDKRISINTIVEKLSPMPTDSRLGNMPRLFFIDACRGNRDDRGKFVTPRGGSPCSTTSRGGNAVESLRIPSTPTNICVAYSTVSGFRSYEMKGEGGIWMQCLAQKLFEVDDTIENVLRKVNGELMKLWQKEKCILHIMNPEYVSRLTEEVNLFREKSECKRLVPEEAQLLPSHESLGLPPSQGLLQEISPIPKVSSVASNPIRVSPPPPPHGASVISPSCRTEGIPLVAQTRTPEVVVSRQTKMSDIGEHRRMLNQYKTKGLIVRSTTKSESQEDSGIPSHHCRILCVLPGGKEITGDSVCYYQGKKNVAEEKAAEDALNKINEFHVKGKSIQEREPAAKQESPTPSYTRELNIILLGYPNPRKPEYVCVKESNGCFQYAVSHPAFGQAQPIIGKECPSKKEAKNSAAWRAWIKFI